MYTDLQLKRQECHAENSYSTYMTCVLSYAEIVTIDTYLLTAAGRSVRINTHTVSIDTYIFTGTRTWCCNLFALLHRGDGGDM